MDRDIRHRLLVLRALIVPQTLEICTMPDLPSSQTRAPKICACVLMNHPFPGNLPILRKLYGGRFSELRFLIPFEQMPDEDVITVYRGSYNHAAYLTDARSELSRLDCDYYLVIHDDVLLNPRISEESFQATFDLGPDDGFISRAGRMEDNMGHWAWYFGFLPKLFYPKSLLFGSGVEYANLVKYLPSKAAVTDAFVHNDRVPATGARFDSQAMQGISGQPSRVLLHGLATPLPDGSDDQVASEARSMALQEDLVETLLHARRITGEYGDNTRPDGERPGPGESTEFPFPLISAGYCTDLYILPKSGFDRFAHFMGVAAAANLFVEIVAPTLLHVCCDRVWQADDRGLDISGFDVAHDLEWFKNPKAVAIHPFKLSAYRDPDIEERFLGTLSGIASAEPESGSAEASGRLFGPADYLGAGWHACEPWGAWAAQREAHIQIQMERAGPVKLRLRAPTHSSLSPFNGTLSVRAASGSVQARTEFTVRWPQSEFDITVEHLLPDDDGKGRITLFSDALVDPQALGGSDLRLLGIGLVSVSQPRSA